MLLYYITDRRQLPGSPAEQRDRLLGKVAEASHAGVDLIQLRERDLSAKQLHQLALDALAVIRASAACKTRLLINSRLDVALACGADGVQLRADDFAASDARAVWVKTHALGSMTRNVKRETRNVVIGVSCHTQADILSAEAHGADFVVYAPVFEKPGTRAAVVGLEELRKACGRIPARDKKVEAGFASGMPILALGGVTLGNARDCIAAGAAGVAGIRLFQDHDVEEVVGLLRG